MPTVTIRPALPSDLPDLSALVATALPELKLVNTTPWSRRLGSGEHWDSNLLLVAVDQQGSLLGTCWADSAIYRDYGCPVPWWCLNVIAVSPVTRGQGLGSRLVDEVIERAQAVGVSSLYGLCVPDVVGFYARQGLSVTAPGARLTSDVAPTDAPDQPLELTAPEDHCWFVTDVGTTPLPRLYLTS
ncbi:GNAT family N-acetyltransferase [Nocardioides sp. MH1]|uniref:GNAT family N-acetyltransferase n=1 Tax=Nocardioides sp. MH1 TaxID=3242490 RepID=UPI003520BFBA